jgi:hypothetical protein
MIGENRVYKLKYRKKREKGSTYVQRILGYIFGYIFGIRMQHFPLLQRSIKLNSRSKNFRTKKAMQIRTPRTKGPSGQLVKAGVQETPKKPEPSPDTK